MKNYLIVPKPYYDESISSFILRLAQENLYERCKWIYDDIGLVSSHKINHIYNCNSNHESILKLAIMSNLNTKEIIDMTFIPIFGEYNNTEDFIDITLGANIHRLNIKFCPKCLKEKLYLRKVWDLHQYNICHVHKCLLLNKCSICGKKVHLKSQKNFLCTNCNTGFIDMESKSYFGKIDAETFLYSKLHNLFNHSVTSNYLNNLSSRDSIYILSSLSGKLYDKSTQSTDEGNTIKSEGINKVFDSFGGFPNSFFNFLEDYSKSPHLKTNFGLQRSFGSLYEGIEGKYRNNKNLTFIYEVFTKFIKEYWDGHVLNSRGNKEIYKNEEWITRSEAKNIIGCRLRTISKLVKNGDIVAKNTKKAKDHTLVKKDSVLEYKKNKCIVQLNNKRLKNYSLSEKQINVLIDLNYLKKGKENNGFKKVDGDQLISFFYKLNHRIVNVIDGNGLIEFQHAIRKYCFQGKGLKGLLVDILFNDAKLYSTLPEVTSLDELLLDEVEINNFLSKRSYKTRKEISKDLSITQPVLKYLLDEKYIEFETINNNIIVTSDSIKKFEAQYMLFKDVRKILIENGTVDHNIQILEQLKKYNIHPINKRVKKTQPNIYLRCDVENKLKDLLESKEEVLLYT